MFPAIGIDGIQGDDPYWESVSLHYWVRSFFVGVVLFFTSRSQTGYE
jgi:hypothetical protein